MISRGVRFHFVPFFFFSSRRRHTRLQGDWSSDVCSSDLSELTKMAKTDGQGVAIIPAVPIGDYHVLVSAPGFTMATDTDVQVTPDKITPVQEIGRASCRERV